MTDTQETDLNKNIISAALECAATDGWGKCSMADIADHAGISEDELRIIFPEKQDILAAFSRMVDEQVRENMSGGVDAELTHRDILFDVMMERFDILNDYRDGLIAVLEAVKCDPKMAVGGIPQIGRSMADMLSVAEIDASGLFGAMKATGLMAVYFDTLRTWKNDDSPDMGKTMAALDKNLERAESVAGIFDGGRIPSPCSLVKRNDSAAA